MHPTEEAINNLIKALPGVDTNLISDGYHTIGELYEHRVALFIVLCNLLFRTNPDSAPWKAKVHADESMFPGWFIAGIGTEVGNQISYHLPLEAWEKLRVPTLEKAPEWDGHMPSDVLNRLFDL